jgi:hypothetical protein
MASVQPGADVACVVHDSDEAFEDQQSQRVDPTRYRGDEFQMVLIAGDQGKQGLLQGEHLGRGLARGESAPSTLTGHLGEPCPHTGVGLCAHVQLTLLDGSGQGSEQAPAVTTQLIGRHPGTRRPRCRLDPRLK